ncbi:MAG: AAA family ATPase, partial [Chloroflexi bacterium]|nr:AAA family ATPase [Chloroflexota bacterium]
MSVKRLEVPAEKLKQSCDPDDLGFETTDEITPLDGTIGQERAISALELALDIDAPGFNLFIAGIPGTGRNTALRTYLERIASQKPIPPDAGYVYNFQEPSQPAALSLPCGMMRVLARDMEDLVDNCSRDIPAVFESDDYTHRIEDVMKDIQDKRQQMTSELEQKAQAEGFTLSFTQVGITPVPLIDGRQMSQDEFNALPDEQREAFKERGDRIQHEIIHLTQEIRRLNKEAAERSREVDTELVRFTLTPIINELQAKYSSSPDVVSYLDQVETDMVENLEMFKPRPDQPPGPVSGIAGIPREEDPFARYRVNDLVDNSTCEGAPIIFEYSPTYYNIFGRIDYRARVGTLTTDLTMIKPGSIHRANGGYLVLQARDLLLNPMSWEALKRSLRSGEVRIENVGEQYSPLPSATLRPQPIPINAKIILVGSPDLLRTLQAGDEDFQRYFKVTADFDTLMERTHENMTKYAAFVAGQCKANQLRPFHKSAVARLIEHSGRLVEDQDKLTTRFMDVSDVITEANYWAGKDSNDKVMAAHVQKAIDQREYRVSMTEDRLRQFIEEGTIHISTEGRKTGQVNGLAIFMMGEHRFGKPSRITARVRLGRGEVVDIERKAELGGPLHT